VITINISSKFVFPWRIIPSLFDRLVIEILQKYFKRDIKPLFSPSLYDIIPYFTQRRYPTTVVCCIPERIKKDWNPDSIFQISVFNEYF